MSRCEDQADIDSLIRFMSGRALGFVAAGGGAFGSAHVGIYKAFRERGVVFDIFVGTSVGSAMAAGFAKNYEADHLERGTHEIFVRSRSFRRPTWPRYALLDHKAFDRALADQYGAQCRIEDCWRPFAAVATNLSTHNLELIRSGLLWQAVRASSAIPGLLPPFYTPRGRDAGRRLPDRQCAAGADASAQERPQSGGAFRRSRGRRCSTSITPNCPGGSNSPLAMLTPFRKKLLPAAPSAVNVLWRSLVAHQRYDTLPTAPHDHVMRPPVSADIGVTEFERHTEIFECVLSLGPRGHRRAGGGRQCGDRRDPRHRQSGSHTMTPARTLSRVAAVTEASPVGIDIGPHRGLEVAACQLDQVLAARIPQRLDHGDMIATGSRCSASGLACA